MGTKSRFDFFINLVVLFEVETGSIYHIIYKSRRYCTLNLFTSFLGSRGEIKKQAAKHLVPHKFISHNNV